MKCMGLCTKTASKDQIARCNKCALLPRSVEDENDRGIWNDAKKHCMKFQALEVK